MLLEKSKCCYSQATATLEGYKYESTAEEIVNEVTDDLMKPVIVEAWKEVIDSHRDVQILEVSLCLNNRHKIYSVLGGGGT